MATGRIEPPAGPDIIEFAHSRKLLGGTVPELSTHQRAALKGLYGLPMERDERLAFLEMSDGVEPRKGGYDEAVLIWGVRSGKTMLAALVGTYESVKWRSVVGRFLIPGQVATGILISQDKVAAGKARAYLVGMLHTLEERTGIQILASTQGQEKAVTGSLVKLDAPIEIAIYPANAYSVRGATGLWFIGDEVAYWKSEDGAYNQDTKVLKAVRTRFATLSRLRPKRLLISSKNEEYGILFDSWKRRHHTPKVMVTLAASWETYPGIDQEYLDVAEEQDPEDFQVEYGKAWRKSADGNVFLPADAIDRCVDRSRESTPPKPGIEYVGWIDAAFKRDQFYLAIGHAEPLGEQTKVPIDFTRAWNPPSVSKRMKARALDDRKVVEEAVEVLRSYGLDRVHGDQFADIPLKSTFAEHGIQFIESPISKPEHTDAMKNLRAALRAGLVDLPNDAALIKDLKGLIKRETQGGHFHVGAPRRKGCYDDGPNTVARIVNRLLPLSERIDIEEWNRGAKSQYVGPNRDWTPRGTGPDFGDVGIPEMGNIMEMQL